MVESRGGLSPPGAPRSVREPLDSHGSRCSAVSMAQLPMSEERRICAAKPIKPVACSFGFETQPFEFAARPSHAYLSVATGARTNRHMDERTRTLYTAPEFRRTALPPIIENK